MITSVSNQAVKTIRGLREKKARAESGLFFIEGLRIVAEALEAGGPVRTLVYSPELLISEFGKNLVYARAESGMDLLEVSAGVFRSLSGKEGPQGLAAVVKQEWTALEEVRCLPGELWAALHSAADPGNLGTILRTLDAVGGKGVFLLDQCTDPYDPTCVRASMGALFTHRFVKTPLGDFLQWAAGNGYPLVGTSDKAPTDYQEYTYPDPMILIMGSERHGLGQDAMNQCEAVVRIPMAGRSDSLNLAVAAGVVLYEIFNQRRKNNSGSRAKGKRP